MINIERLRGLAEPFGIALDTLCLERLQAYARLLLEWNERMNLTAITQPEEVEIKHFLDSLLVSTCLDVPHGTSLVDVGTGAGFPGLVLKILHPELKLTLLDSLNKRLTFLQAVLDELGLTATLLHARAEEAGRTPLRESCSCATARAVAQLPQLAEYCLPLVAVGGSFIAMKGGQVEAELAQSQNAIARLGGRLEQIKSFTLPGGDGRSLVIIKKISQTPTQFPRNAAKIAKNPL